MSRSISLLLQAHPMVPLVLLLGTGLAVGLTGCDRSRELAVRVSIPDPDSVETPAAGVGVVALPYDRDSVLASLEARARTPRPHTAALDSMFARFRGPFTVYTALSYDESLLRDSLRRLWSRLDSVPRDSPGYSGLSAQHRRMSDSLTSTSKRAGRARAVLDRARLDFVARSESLRTAVRQWEDTTYLRWESIGESLARARHREPVTDTTDATGWAHFTLAPGAWWIYARAWDTSDPNSQWYWNVPADSDTVLLSSRSGQRRPRY